MSTDQTAQRTVTPPGPAPPGSPTTGARHDRQVDEIVDRLQRRYPHKQISSADLESRVRGLYHHFDTTRVRTYVAVFVERLVRRSIDNPS